MQDDQRTLAGRYRLVELVGRGAVADVWRAHDDRLGRDVAVKLFRGDAAEELGDAQEEVRMLARLDHPNLVSVLDTGTEDGGEAWIVTQYVDGESLDALIAEGPLAAVDAAWYGAEVASALAYVHGQGLVHRDVKPGNVLIGRNGRVYLTDFGIARIVDSPRRTVSGEVVGTPAFFSPEQVSGERVGPPTDVYALGLLLLESLTGRREFPGGAMESAMARLHRDPEIPAALPPAWRNLIRAMTSRDPAGRPVAAQVEQRLRAVVNGDTEATAAMPVAPTADATQALSRPIERTAVIPPARPAAATAAGSRRRVFMAVIIAMLVVGGAAVGAAVTLSGNGGQRTPSYVNPGHPGLRGQLENDMEQLEQAVRP